MKGLFIPEITAEMFRNGCLESIEALMAEGEIYDIEYSKWIPVSERLPEEQGWYLVTIKSGDNYYLDTDIYNTLYKNGFRTQNVIAWMPLPEPYKSESER